MGDKLLLPPGCSLENLRAIRDALLDETNQPSNTQNIKECTSSLSTSAVMGKRKLNTRI